MAELRLSLIVIRALDIDVCRGFYEAIGCRFIKHSHGNGPQHYACVIGDAVFEIYPLRQKKKSTTATRLGFRVDDIEAVVAKLIQAGGKLVQEPTESEWGTTAVFDDPEGHRIEITTDG